MIIW